MTPPEVENPLRSTGDRLMAGVRRFLQRPGTADAAPYRRLLPAVAAHEERLRQMTDDELRHAARAATDEVLWCALGREAARRALGERAYDVQVLGALALLAGRVVEMATGEGKTLVGAIAAAGHALGGRSVQVWSVNDYLARRDAEWMRPVYDLLGVSVAWIGQGSAPQERRAAYAAQITYAPVSEVGFDVLRDRAVTDVADLVDPAADVVIIDEADSVLVDEAMVPLVLAGSTDDVTIDREMAQIVEELLAGVHYEVDEDARNVMLTDAGARAAERRLGGIELYTAEHAATLSRLNVALHARVLLHKDVDYLVVDGRVQLISASRGRVAQRQRWPDGLHAAVEALEGLHASESGEVLDQLTIQSLVRARPTVCGMTGTALGVAEELREFYQLEVVVVPPHRPCVRTDEPDRLFATLAAKQDAVVHEVAEMHALGRPVLIGTLDVAESEQLAAALTGRGLTCRVLNAKNDAAEAAVIAEAGARGAITVSTQMAGRGTDIRLGGSAGAQQEVAALGGLHVIGTGRHPSGRLDRQLRGRAGRQGDPGSSVLFTSVEDALAGLAPELERWTTGDEDGRIRAARAQEAMEHAQRVAEGQRLEIHRNTWRYHRLLEDQRRIVLAHRDRVLRTDAALKALSEDCPERVAELRADLPSDVVALAARQVTLRHLDLAWTDHLAQAADLREGIHLRALGRGLNPLDEFNRELIASFGPLLDDAAQGAAATLRTITVTADGADLDAEGLSRPTATWTYLVHDDPFGSDLARALGSLGRFFRRGD